MSAHSIRPIALLAGAASLVVAPCLGCSAAPKQNLDPETLAGNAWPTRVWVTTVRAEHIILAFPRVEGDSLRGDLESEDPKGSPSSRGTFVSIALTDVAKIQIEDPTSQNQTWVTLAVLGAAVAIALVIALAHSYQEAWKEIGKKL